MKAIIGIFVLAFGVFIFGLKTHSTEAEEAGGIPSVTAKDAIERMLDVQRTVNTMKDSQATCTTPDQEKVEAAKSSCQIVYELSANMSRHTRSLPLETMLSMLALGAGRTGDFTKYLSEKKGALVAGQMVDQKVMNKELKSSDELIKKTGKAIKKALKASKLGETDPSEVVKFLRETRAELTMLESQNITLNESLKSLEKELETNVRSRNELAAPYWPLKLLQIAFAAGILGHEIFLCREESSSCVMDQVMELVMPVPVSNLGDGTMIGRYEAVPALLILDVERKKITPDMACSYVQHSKKLIQDFGMVKVLYEEMK